MQVILTDRKEIAQGTMAFWFRPERPLKFTAGQFADFTLADPPYTDAQGNDRSFSFASSPGDEHIMIATRMRESAFKKSLRTLPIGTGVDLMGPMGGFTLHKDASRPAVFLTGGIGITPVRSIVAHATEEQLAHRLTVFYSNKTRALTAFFEDFQEWSRVNSNLVFVPTLDGEQPEDWPFELGVIDEAMLRRHIPDLQRPVYYVVGPPPMVAAMKTLLEKIGVDELQIRTEDFIGY